MVPFRSIAGGLINQPRMVVQVRASNAALAEALAGLFATTCAEIEFRPDVGHAGRDLEPGADIAGAASHFRVEPADRDRGSAAIEPQAAGAAWSFTASSRFSQAGAPAPKSDLQIIGVEGAGIDGFQSLLRLAHYGTPRRVGVCPRPDARSDVVAMAGDLAGAFGDHAEVCDLSPAKAASAIVSRTSRFDLIIADDGSARIFAAVAAEIYGAAALAAITHSAGDCLWSEPLLRPATKSESSAAAMIVAGARLLAALGRGRPAALAENALLRSLEDNLHPAGVRPNSPYARQLDDLAFVAAVQARIGVTPRRLRAVRSPEDGNDRDLLRFRPRLRLASSN